MPAQQSGSSNYATNETANDRLKRRVSLLQSEALVFAVAVHVAVFMLWPTMSAGVITNESNEVQVILPPDIEIPPAPQQLARPAAPVISTAAIDENITIASTVEAWKAENIAPPPTRREIARDSFVAFVATMLAPRVLNQQEVERALERYYPPTLRDAGIGGVVEVLLWLDESGAIVKAEVAKKSGYAAFDEAALKVVDVMRLSAARNRDIAVRVIVSIPIKFTVR